MKIKNIVIINDFNYVQGGASKVAIDSANLLVKKGYKVYFFSGDSKTEVKELDASIIQVCTNQGEALKDKNKLRGALNGIYNQKAKKELNKLLAYLDPKNTIVHVHGWTKCLSSSIFSVAFQKKFKIILTLHEYFTACPNGGFFQYPQDQICHLKALSMKCICKNCDSRNYFFKLYRVLRQLVQNNIVKLTKKISYVIYISDLSWKILKPYFNTDIVAAKIENPVDYKFSIPSEKMESSNYYLYVGRVAKEKGVDLFCEALSKLSLKGIVIGDGEEKDILQKKYKNIEFLGWKNHSEIIPYLKSAKALIFPSKWYEGAGLTVLEALTFNIPCIVSDPTAACEFIEEGKNGLRFKTGNLLDLCDKIKIMEKESKQFKNFFTDPNRWSKEFYLQQLVNFFEKII